MHSSPPPKIRRRSSRRTLGPWSLTAFGIGAVIGSGIFILTGTAAAGEKLSYKSILHAPVLDLLMHGAKRALHIGPPGRRSGDHSFLSADWRSRAVSRHCAMRNWRR